MLLIWILTSPGCLFRIGLTSWLWRANVDILSRRIQTAPVFVARRNLLEPAVLRPSIRLSWPWLWPRCCVLIHLRRAVHPLWNWRQFLAPDPSRGGWSRPSKQRLLVSAPRLGLSQAAPPSLVQTTVCGRSLRYCLSNLHRSCRMHVLRFFQGVRIGVRCVLQPSMHWPIKDMRPFAR